MINTATVLSFALLASIILTTAIVSAHSGWGKKFTYRVMIIQFIVSIPILLGVILFSTD